MSNKMTL